MYRTKNRRTTGIHPFTLPFFEPLYPAHTLRLALFRLILIFSTLLPCSLLASHPGNFSETKEMRNEGDERAGERVSVGFGMKEKFKEQ